MGAIFLAPVYLLLNGYLLFRLFGWLGALLPTVKKIWLRIPFFLIFVLTAAAPLISFLLPASWLRSFLGTLGQCWLGILVYLLLTAGLTELVCFFLRRTGWWQRRRNKRRWFAGLGAFVLLLTAGISAYGIFHAGNIIVRTEELKVDKACARNMLRIVLLADLHLGCHTEPEGIQNLVDKANAQNADLICVAGDIFDNDYTAIQKPEEIANALSRLKSRYGVFACYGNHDVHEKILAGFTFSSAEKKVEDPRFSAFLERAGITLLQDEGVLIDNAFYLFGRKDPSKAKKAGETRKTPEELLSAADRQKPVIVMDHQPKELSALAEAGADIDLSGHTHNGQIAPVNLFLPLIYENPYGILQKDGMYSCVTSGAGVWGPAMRVGTDSEIMVITVYFD